MGMSVGVGAGGGGGGSGAAGSTVGRVLATVVGTGAEVATQARRPSSQLASLRQQWPCESWKPSSHCEVHQATPATATAAKASTPTPSAIAVPPDLFAGACGRSGAGLPLTIHGGTPEAITGIIAVPLGGAVV